MKLHNNEIILSKEMLRNISEIITSLKMQVGQLEEQVRILRLNNLGGSQCQN